MTNIVFLSKKNTPITTSRILAETFVKLHKDVLKAIDNLECSADFRQSNFALSYYEQKMPNGGTKQVPEHLITRDGFTFLAMGFTGSKAAQFKESYIAAFNAMEKQLNGSKPKVLSRIEMLQQMLQAETEKERLQLQVGELAPKAASFDRFMSSEETVTMEMCAKLLSERKGTIIGRNKLFDFLRQKRILQDGGKQHNVPYQSYIDRRYFNVIARTWKDPESEKEHLTFETLVYPQGIDYIQKLLTVSV